MGASSSVVVQETWTSLVYQPLLPSVPAMFGVTTGAERSIFTAGVVNVALLPAESVTTTDAVRLLPVPVIVTGLALLVE